MAPAALWLCGSVEATRIVAVGTTEQGTARSLPGERSKLVDGGDEEGGEAAVDGLVDGDNREGAIPGKVTGEVATDDPHVGRLVGIGQQRE